MAAVLVLLLLALPLSCDVVTGCNFPDFLESRAEDGTARRDWRTHWRQHVFHHEADDASSSTSTSSTRVIFDGRVMRSEETSRQRLHQVNGESNVGNETHHRHHQRHGDRHSRPSFTRQCQQTVVSDDGQTRYLATHRQVGESETKFICIEFVPRSSAVVQVRFVVSEP